MRHALILVVALASVACSSDGDDTAGSESGAAAVSASTAQPASPDPTTTPEGAYPDVIAVEATQEDAGTWRFDVTVSSPYDTPDRYADAWRVLGPDGAEFGVRVLTHDHAAEQPFTRSLTGVPIPEGVDTVVVQGRDLVNGWGGGQLELDLLSP